jgi:hypothetical protein
LADARVGSVGAETVTGRDGGMDFSGSRPRPPLRYRRVTSLPSIKHSAAYVRSARTISLSTVAGSSRRGILFKITQMTGDIGPVTLTSNVTAHSPSVSRIE